MKAPKPKPASWEDIRQAAGVVCEEIPPGALNVAGYAKEFHLSQKGAYNEIQRLIQDGTVRSARGRRAGDSRPMQYYWPA